MRAREANKCIKSIQVGQRERAWDEGFVELPESKVINLNRTCACTLIEIENEEGGGRGRGPRQDCSFELPKL